MHFTNNPFKLEIKEDKKRINVIYRVPSSGTTVIPKHAASYFPCDLKPKTDQETKLEFTIFLFAQSGRLLWKVFVFSPEEEYKTHYIEFGIIFCIFD